MRVQTKTTRAFRFICRRRGLLGIIAVAIVAAASAPAASNVPSIALWGSREVRATTLHLFPKWTGVLERYFNEQKLADAPCSATTVNRCHLREWSAFIADLRDRDAMSQLIAVNREMNRRRYVTDPVNYGVDDYWATPLQFFVKNGDCEDYAITKYMSLRALGFADDSLRIVVLQDLNLRVAHAILVVQLSGRSYALDNQIPDVIETQRIHHYRPIYSVNERYWWFHRYG